MNRIAIISDLHGNLPALNAVLKDLDERQPDAIFCLGDLVDFAPWPNEVIETIRHRRIPTLMGNHDERIAFQHKIVPLEKHSAEERAARVLAIEHTRNVISPENRAYLADLPRSMRITFGGSSSATRILLVHASTRSIDEYIFEDHPEPDVKGMLRKNNVDILVMGHTHLPYIRKLSNRRYAFNAGSVGRSKERDAHATYLMLTMSESHSHPQIIRVKYPVDITVATIRASEIPEFYADFWLERTNN
jgi:predicted phosphodiesterase